LSLSNPFLTSSREHQIEGAKNAMSAFRKYLDSFSVLDGDEEQWRRLLQFLRAVNE
jgi:hypothetical protein